MFHTLFTLFLFVNSFICLEFKGVLGWLGIHLEETEVRDMIAQYDDDASGEIGLNEFVVLMVKQVWMLNQSIP